MIDLLQKTTRSLGLPEVALPLNGHKKDEKPITSPHDGLEFARRQQVAIVDLKFIDLPGTWQHFSIPVTHLKEDVFEEGLGFDGSSIRGFQEIHESDMILIPDPATAIIDPVCEMPTLSLICHVYDPVTLEPYSRDPRYVARKAERFLVATGIADVSYWGPEAEFFIFDNVRFDQDQHSAYYYVDSDEGAWNSGRNGDRPNSGYRPRYKEGYFPVPPTDSLQNLRSDIIVRMLAAGVDVEVHHHEVATAGQCEIDMRFTSLTRMADQLMLYKYIIKNVALAHGKTATFMP